MTVEEPVKDPEEIEDEAPASEEDETSLDEIIAKKADEGPEEAEEEEAVVPTGRDERVEALTVKVVPQQPTEFTCRNCYLVKHRSQLADKKRMLCRDCA
ncbi:MAG TPA: DUF4193 family protein [Actinomycetota bacterium]|nr:DUF4193 family protein [Actinomycetota bacterium]